MHTLEVRAVDGAGNVQGAPYAAAAIVVDTVAPVVALCAPASGNGSGSGSGTTPTSDSGGGGSSIGGSDSGACTPLAPFTHDYVRGCVSAPRTRPPWW